MHPATNGVKCHAESHIFKVNSIPLTHWRMFIFLMLAGSEAEALWINLKARYTRQRKVAKTLAKSGSSMEEIQQAQDGLQIYKKLRWLDDFVMSRRRIWWRNPNRIKNITGLHCHEPEEVVDYEAEEIKRVGEETETDDNSMDVMVVEECSSQTADTITFDNTEAANKIAAEGHKRLLGSKPLIKGMTRRTMSLPTEHGKRKKNGEVASSPILEDKNFLEKGKNEFVDEDELYGTLVASQLRKLPEYQKLQAKHQINNVLFQAQMEEVMARQQNASPSFTYPQQPTFVQNSAVK